MPFNVELPNGQVIEGIPDGTTKEEIRLKAINAGIAQESDFPQLASNEPGSQITGPSLQVTDDLPVQNNQSQPQAAQRSVVQQPTNEQPQEGIGERFLIGAGSGLTAAGEGLEQIGREATIATRRQQLKQLKKSGRLSPEQLSVFENEIISAQKELEEFNQEVAERREFFNNTPVGQTTASKVGEFVGEAAPTLLVPGAVKGTLIKKGIAGAATGGAVGGSQFVEEDQSRAGNAAVGATIGAAIPAAIKPVQIAAGKAKEFLLPILGGKTTGLIKKLGGDELLQSTAKRIESAKRLGIDFITPAEATGDSLLAKRQGNIGTSDTGFKLLNNAGRRRVQNEKEIITQFLEDLSPSGSNANKAVQSRARKILKVDKYLLSRAARPFYKKAYQQEIPEDSMQRLLSDPVIAREYEKVLASPVFQRELGDTATNSIKTLDIVKRSLDDVVEVAKRQGNSNEARILTKAKNELLRVADIASDDYAQARAIFSTGSPAIEKLEKGIVGKLANMDLKSLKTVSKTLFDPNETDPQVLVALRDKFTKGKGKEVWNRIIRNEIERRIDASAQGQTGTTVFKQLLEKDRDFRMFMTATKHLPGTRKALVDMRRVFKDLINPASLKGAAKLAQNSTNVERSSLQYLFNFVRDYVGGAYDKVQVEIITNPQWHDDLAKALSEGSKLSKIDKFASLVSKASASQSDEINSDNP